MKRRFEVVGRLDSASKVQRGTLTIDTVSGIASVRPFRRRKVYELSVSGLAEILVQRAVRAELVEKRKEKAERRKMRGRK